jgi:hypothetical protein
LCRALLAARQPLPGFFVHSFRQRLPFFRTLFSRGRGCRFSSDFRQRLPLTSTTPPLSDSSLPRRADLELPPARPAWRTPR